MQTEVSILHHDYPSSVRNVVTDKLEHLAHYFERVITLRAQLECQHDEHRVELVATVPRGALLKVDSRANSLDEALDGALGRMKRVLAEHKAKLSKVTRRKTR